MKTIPISEVITDKISGEWGEDGTQEDGVVVIRTANFTKDATIDYSNVVFRKIDDKKVEKKQLLNGDIIIEKSGGSPTQPVGRVVLFRPFDNRKYLCNNFTSILRPDTEKIFPEYFYYVLRFNHLIGKTLRYQNKTTGIINLKLDNYLASNIPLPPLDDQKRIAHLLGKVEGMIARRKQHLQQLDELLKSVFLEMFGDHFVQESHKSFGEYIDVLTDYHANGSYEILRDHVELQTTPNFALMVRTTDLENNNFDNGCNYITEEAYEFLSKSKVYGGEIIINKIGSAGRVYLMPFLNRPVSLGMNAFLLRFNEDLNNIYVYHLLTSDFGTKAIQKHVKGAVTKTITKNAIRSIKIPVPPITLQNQFAAIVEKVESLKSRYQSSLTNLENLYGVLSQKAFKGELDLSRVPMEEETR
jgi:type I restriction enzyme S subunit